jgi:signal transduction histidine kinase
MYATISRQTDVVSPWVPYGHGVRSLVDRLRTVDKVWYDVAVATGLAVIGAIVLATADAEPPQRDADVWAYVLVIVAIGALVLRSRAPVSALIVSTIGTVVLTVSGYAEGPTPVAILVAFYSVASAPRPRSRLIGAGVLFGAFAVLYVFNDRSGFSTGDIATNLVFFSATWVAGERMRARHERVALLEERAERAVREQEERAHRAIADERLRIAQELHDVVAHAMSVITVQAGVGAHVIDTRPDEAKKALSAIETTGRQALHELRLMLGLLRQHGDPKGLRSPVPCREDIAQLVESVRATGLDVELRWHGDTAIAIPPSVFVSAYRIVQESLTNVLKHAGMARATVDITIHADHTSIEVVDDGRGAASRAAGTGSGFGLIGMHERVAVLGGTLDVGPRTGGGFAVLARLPHASVVTA